MKEKIITYIITEFHNGNPDLNIDPDDDLLSSGLVGSLSMIKLIQYIETEAGIKVPPQDMTIEHFMTVQAMDDYIENRRAAAN